jgi:3D (Asp-Asp-Asp) domain-containing protein
MNKFFIAILATCVFASSQISVAKESPAKSKSHYNSKKSKSKKVKFAKKSKKKKFRHSLKVTATAYNSLRAQTDSTPNIAAWGDRLRPGMRVIAVSRDLLRRSGLKHNTLVKIKGYPGTYRVKDKMNRRFRKRIDIYMGKNRRKARRFGMRKVVINW